MPVPGDARRPPSLPQLLRPKFQTPTVRAGTLERHRLSQRLDSHLGATLVAAPPGFGKTTLLTHWCRAADRASAWVSLDEADNDPVLLWRYIVAAVNASVPAALTSVVREPDVVGVVVPTVLNELQSLERELTVVLDDYHVIVDPTCHRSIELLLHRRPANVRVVVASRANPPVRLGRMRAAGELQVLGSSDLAFTRGETDELLNDRLGLDLPADALSTLHERSEGWPAALYLAYLSLRDAPDRAEAVAEFRGSSRNVVDYLTEVVLDPLDDTVREFLLDTSVLDRLCGPLCDVVVERSDSAHLLEELARANLLVIPLDAHREWYRYHRLLADLLRDELQRRRPDRLPALHRRASAWLADAGRPGEAIRHAIAAGELETAIDLVATNYLTTIEWAGFATVASWLDAFPRPVVVGDARLSIVEAWVMSFLNRPDDAEAALRHALERGHEGPLPDGASSVEASEALLRAGFPSGDVGEMVAAARRAFEFEGQRESLWKVTVHVQLGWALLLAGRPDEARPLLERGAALAPVGDQWLNAVGARCLLAWLCLDAGEVVRAEHYAREADKLVRRHGLTDRAVSGYALATLGATVARRGDVRGGDELLDLALARMRGAAPPFLLIQALLAHVATRRALGHPAEARRLLTEAQELVEGCPDPGILRQRFEEAALAMASAGPHAAPGTELTPRELDVLGLLERGFSQRQIAGELFVSHHTIHSHLRSIYRKLGVSTRAGAIARAREQRLVPAWSSRSGPPTTGGPRPQDDT